MSDKHYVDNDLFAFSNNGLQKPVSRITLLLDDENVVTAGDDTGMELVADCPYADEALAKTLLDVIKGYQYQAFEAESANIDPAAELGDGVKASGVAGILAHISDRGDGYPDISAPGDREEEEEYPEGGYVTQSFNRKIAETRSLIEKTAEEIRLEVAGVENEISYIQLDLESITSRVQDAEGNISTLEQTATSLRSEISGKLDSDEAQSLIDQTLEGIELSVSSKNGSTTFKLTADGVTLSTKTLDLTVDAVNISGTLAAAALIGRTVGLLTSDEDEAGGIEITGASTSDYAVELYSEGALRLMAYNGSAFLGSDEGASIEVSDRIWMNDHIYPSSPNSYNCGNANFPWAMVYSTNGLCETSDRKKKKNIEYGLDRFDGFFDDMKASSYQMVNGTSGRRHNGFIADDIRDNLDKHGISTKDFGGYVADVDKDGNEILGLRYSEFIPLLVEQVQKLKARVVKLEGKKHGV